MKEPVFVIEELKCSYTANPADAVLYIPRLEIPRGQVVFLIGASGSGKSTLLETLGLMNNTIASGSIRFYPPGSSKPEKLEALWQSGDDRKLSEFRKKHFSFIFQNTNLMENFSAYENISLAPMIQQGVSQQQTLDEVKTNMQNVNLPLNQVGLTTLAANLSGGQRQRIAFVRALSSKFSVLFGDEPTGNLDENNAHELMRIVSREAGEDKTVVIVSHDINLALAHAGMIVCIGHKDASGCSRIEEKDIYHRSSWENMNLSEREAFKSKLRAYYSKPEASKEEQIVETGQIPETTRLRFRRLFHLRESKALSGKGRMNFVLLTLLFWVTLLAIGFGNGSLRYLESKMNNAFVKWITVTVPWSRSNVTELRDHLNSPDVKNAFGIRSVTGYKEKSILFFNRDRQKFQRVRCRSIDPARDELVRDLLAHANRMAGDSTFRRETDFGIVVTSRVLKDLGYDMDISHLPMGLVVRNELTDELDSMNVPVPIRAVVNEIPGKVQVVFTDYFLRAYEQANAAAFDIRTKPNLDFYYRGEKSVADSIQRTIKNFFRSTENYQTWDPEVLAPVADQSTWHTGYLISTTFYSLYDSIPAPKNQMAAEIAELPYLKSLGENFMRVYDFNAFKEEFGKDESYNVLSINMKSLDRIREFNSYLLNECNEENEAALIEIDIGKVKEKENFNFLSKVALVISWLVIVFSAISISLFILNLLKMHLGKVRMNIGTLKAFGLGNAQSQSVYFFIIMRFVGLSLVLALALAYLAGQGLNFLFHFAFVIEEGVNYFQLFNAKTYVAMGIVLVCATLVSRITIKRMLNKSPGDLIYNR